MGKRLELLKEVVPKLSRIAIFETQPSCDIRKNETEYAVALEVKFQYLDRRTQRFESAFPPRERAR